MLFNSFEFLVFALIVIPIYFFLKHQYRWLWLLVSSCVFYMYFIPAFILVLFAVIIIDYIAAQKIFNAKQEHKKKWLIVSLVANLGILFFFKYFHFFVDNINALAAYFPYIKHRIPYINIILPLGLSFHTFQAISYTIEVYRGKQQPEKHFGIYALYVMFFPQLVAGPIERPQNMLHQFHKKINFNYDLATSGLKLIAWGLFKKVVIADRLAAVVDRVYAHPNDYNSLSLSIATVFLLFQIYCDFSGYSDIALGSARIMGFTLMKNFDNPFQVVNIQEFWRKWHISLTTWFRDYLYKPLGEIFTQSYGKYICIFIVFTLSGFWHGANWTFIAWGFVHGLFLIGFMITKNIRSILFGKIKFINIRLFSMLLTFILVALATVFFRVRTVQEALLIYKKIIFEAPELLKNVISHKGVFENLGIPNSEILFGFGLIFFLELIQYLQAKYQLTTIINSQKLLIRWATYFAIGLCILHFGKFNANTFVYFQF